LSISIKSAIKSAVSATARWLTAALMIASWIAISNHCVFGAIAPGPARAQNECPFHSKPAKPNMPPAGVQCCKILRATTTAPAKIPDRAVVDLPHVDLVLAQPIVIAPAKISFAGDFLDTGPPGKTSFIDLIGSSPRRAPPSRV